MGITVFLLALMHLLIILSGIANFHMMRRVSDVHLTTTEDRSLNNDSSNSAGTIDGDVANNPKLNSIRGSNNKSHEASITMPTIPRRLIFTYKYNLLHPSKDDPPYDENDALTANVLHTIRTYKRHWELIDKQQGDIVDNNRQREVTISFLSNDDCIAVINKAQPKLVQYFIKEKRGDLKADTCR